MRFVGEGSSNVHVLKHLVHSYYSNVHDLHQILCRTMKLVRKQKGILDTAGLIYNRSVPAWSSQN